ncbi:MAG: type II methionyl aminopeptidase [Nitrososphaerales archaeon]
MNTRIPEQYVKSGRIAREIRQWILGNVRAGSGLLDVAEKIEAEIVRRGGQPAFPTGLGVNEVTAHYAPQEDERGVIQETDVVKIDYGVHIDGYIADTSITITENPQYQSLLEATEKALQAAIDVVKRDKRIGEIGKAISSVAEREGYRPINNLSGHTVEQYQVHAGKSIPNLYAPNLPMLKNADVFAIEPFLTLPDAAGYVVDGPQVNIFSLIVRRKTGNKELDEVMDLIWNERKTLPFSPRWYSGRFKEGRLLFLLRELEKRRLLTSYSTLVEASGKPVAQFEHTMAIDDGGLVILT